MVRVLTCHHFDGQLIGQCEEAVGVTLAESVIIIAHENRISIYSCLKTKDLQSWFSKKRHSLHFGKGEIGKYFSYHSKSDSDYKNSTKDGTSHDDEFTKELKLLQSFAPVDRIKTISYNRRGHYLLSLEKHDVGVTNSDAHSVRAYFQWDKKTDGTPLRARVAGLVSPTGGEWEEGSIKMIEIPPTPLFATRAVSSCALTGNIACLSSDARVNIYSFNFKEGSGRIKTQYADFDLICTVQLSGPSNFSPERISFSLDFISCSDTAHVTVFRIVHKDILEGESTGIKKKPGFEVFSRVKTTASEVLARSTVPSPPPIQHQVNGFQSHPYLQNDAVVFDPKNESTKIYLRTISKANRKSLQKEQLVFNEEFQEEITTYKSVSLPQRTQESKFIIEDSLRITADVKESTNSDFIQVELYPVRIKGNIGGVSCIVGTAKEVFVYNLPIKRRSFVTRVSSHPLTSNLVSLSFDSLFLHAMTETGLETYTMRNLYHPLKEEEGYQVYENDCPLLDESPVLVGIRPFPGLRYLASNDSTLCLLSSPVPPDTVMIAVTNPEETHWTIYSLRAPKMTLLHDDVSTLAHSYKENSENYFILLSELHILLRATMNAHPESASLHRTKYLNTCRLIGFEYFKNSTKAATGLESNELLDKGVTYLRMSNCDLQYIFSSENSGLTKDPALIPGIVRFIQISLPVASIDPESRLAPKICKQIVEFLANHSSLILIELVLDVPWLRECNSTRLVEILNPLAEEQKYKCEVALALILSLVARHGEDLTGRTRVKEVLSKCHTSELESRFQLDWLLTQRNKQYCLSDLAICLSAAETQVHINVLSGALNSGGIGLNDVVVPFLQGVNLNSDVKIQQSLSKSLSRILENYFAFKLENIDVEDPSHNTLIPVVAYSPDEIRALHTLIRSYLSNISNASAAGNPNSIASPVSSRESSTVFQTTDVVENGETQIQVHQIDSALTTAGDDLATTFERATELKWQLFGKSPSFLEHLVPGLSHDKCSPVQPSPLSSLECRENFTKLTSLLGSRLGHADGVHHLVLTTLKQSNLESHLHSSLELLCESSEKAIEALMTDHPSVLMLYAKEMFGKSTRRWKLLVSKLKEKIKSKPEKVDTFVIIIESVYLHVANILSPTELEEVLDKEEENAKFYAACRRVELANTFKQKVMDMSSAYLDQAK